MALRNALPVGAAAILLALLAWPDSSFTPAPGLDNSWAAALHLIADGGLNWGTDALFTYGPLGYLDIPVYWSAPTGRAAIVFQLAERALLGAVVLLALRRSFGLVIAAPLALLVTSLAIEPVLPAVAFIGAVAMVAAPLRGREATVAVVALSALAVLELMVKLNAGVTVAALAGVAALLHPERRRLVPIVAATLAGGFLLTWLATGQALGALDDYVKGVARIVSGYSQTMMIEDPTRHWEYAGALVVYAAGAAACWMTGVRGSRDHRLALLALWTLLAFMSFKSGFVRHDGHSTIYFGTAVVALCGLRFAAGQRLLGGLVLSVAVVAMLAITPHEDLGSLAPGDRFEQGVDALASVVDGTDRAAAMTTGREAVVAGTAIPPDVLDAARRSGPVAIYPFELSVAFAGRLAFRPFPVLQDYQAYTPGLDETNREFLAADDAPGNVLVHDGDGAVDGRLTVFNTPATMRELVCRYRPTRYSGGPWILVRRGPDRCVAEPRLVGSVRARWGERMAVPAPTSRNAFVFVRIAGAAVGGLERLRSLLFRAHDRQLLLDDGLHRLAPAVAGGGAIVRSGSQADLPGGYGVAPDSRSIAVDRNGDPDRDDPALRFDFYEQELTR